MTDPADCGPVTLAFCQDVQARPTTGPRASSPRRSGGCGGRSPIRWNSSAWPTIIAEAKAPVIVAGGGVHYSARDGGAEGLRRGAPDPGRRDAGRQVGAAVGPSAEPRPRGRHRGGRRPTRSAREADVVIGVGTRFQDFTTGSWALFQNPHRRLISLNVNAYDALKHGAEPLVRRCARRARRSCRASSADHAFAAAVARAQGGLVRRRRSADGRAVGRQRAAHRHAGDRRGAARGGAGHGRDVRRRHDAGRAAQALEGDAAHVLPHGIRLLLHGLRDRGRAWASRWPSPTATSSACWATAAT